MRQIWSSMELNTHWLLGEDETHLLKGKTITGRVLFVVLLKYYQRYACFPEDISHIPDEVVEFIAAQIDINFEGFGKPKHLTRSIRDYCREIRQFLGVKRFGPKDKKTFQVWAAQHLFTEAPNTEKLDEDIRAWFSANRFERPASSALSRLVAAAERQFEQRLFQQIVSHLNPQQEACLEALLNTSDGPSNFIELRADPGSASLKSIVRTINRLQLLRDISLSESLLESLHPALVERYRLRAGAEDVWALKRHPKAIRLALLCFYCAARETQIIDGLVDLLISITHKISARAEKKVINELISQFTKVEGKANLLFRIAVAAEDCPEGTVRDVIYPVAGEQTIADLVKEYRADGPAYTHRIYRKIRTSYAQHYRQMLPLILNTLEFHSNNNEWRPLLVAIDLLKNNSQLGARYFSLEEVPVEGVVRNKWRDIVIEEGPQGKQRINRINYEICVLQSLRNKLRSKEIWVGHAKRFCNPEKDLPFDFERQREAYYSELGQPLSVDEFINTLATKMRCALTKLDAEFPNNTAVKIKTVADKPRLSVSPFAPQPEPPTLDSLKRELGHRWPATSLLDILKETDLRVGFTKEFTSTATRSALKKDEVSRRLLLALYGLGTNAGLKALSAGPNNVSYKELLYIHQRYIHQDNLRQAIRSVVNATLQVRSSEVWGSGTTSCASDSTRFAAWDQNLMTEWHQRYGGRGVMIYWHVDTQSTCIHSQLKRCSSSEVASMIEGVLHHCTEMEIDRQYVDTHGQSIIAFAFCYLLGFELMPRFKGIHKQKLLRPDAKQAGDYPHLEGVFYTSAINWNLIEQQYDEVIKLAVALLKRTAEPEAILRRFTRNQTRHPAYAALIELGKAAKTLFLCKYLGSEDVRREIHTGLNVVERWNGVNDFIYFGKSGEMATNQMEAQEVSALSLHLLQASMVYINTLMIQDVLAEPSWRDRMTARDKAALSPLPHSHLNPYGVFDLDMEQRLSLATERLAA